MSENKKTLVFEATPKQEQFINAVLSSEYRVLTFGGAIRGGKTFVALGLAILLARVYPKSRWTVVRQSLKRLKDNTRPSLNKFLENSGIKINEQDQTFTFKNGSVIIFKGENYDRDKTLESFKGHETNGFILEEVSEIRHETFKKCQERAGSWVITPKPKAGQPPPLIIMTCNPTQSWVKDVVYDPWINGTLNPKWFYLPSYVTDNPYLDNEYLESLKDLPLYEYEVFVKGNWDISLKVQNAFWHAFDVNEHIKPIFYNSRSILHVSIDSNSMPYCAATLWQIFPDEKKAVQIHEITAAAPKNHAGGLASMVVDYLESIDYEDVLHTYGDATTKSQNTIDPQKRSFYDIFIEELAAKYHTVDYIASSNPSVALTGEFVNALYAGYDGWTIEVHEGCKTSISDYLTVKKDMDGTMKKEKEKDEEGNSFEKYGHLSDTKRYFLFKALDDVLIKWKNRFSTPQKPINIDIEEDYY